MKNIVTIFERICEISPYKSLVELGEILGTDATNVRSWKKRDKIPYDQLVKYALSTGISLDWLVFGRGARYSDLLDLSDEISVDKANSIANNFEVDYYENNKKVGTMCLPPDLIVNSGEICAYKIKDDSMSPTIGTNSIVFVEKKHGSILNGSIYMLEINGETIAKRLFRTPYGIVIKGDNSIYPEYTVKENTLNIKGIVKGVAQRI